MDKLNSPLVKSRVPRTTYIFDKIQPTGNSWGRYLFKELTYLNPHCPLRKGIIYYCCKNIIFERNIRSSIKREVHPSQNAITGC